MPQVYTIGQLARSVSVPASTVRYYERLKLIGAKGRTEGNYRIYGPEALHRLQFIRAAQAHGFTLQDVATMLAFRDGERSPCGEVQTLIERRLADLDHRIGQLHHLQGVLKASLAVCKRSRRATECKVLNELEADASHQPGKSTPRRRVAAGRMSRHPRT